MLSALFACWILQAHELTLLYAEYIQLCAQGFCFELLELRFSYGRGGGYCR